MYIVTRNDVVVKSTIVKVRLLLGYSDFPGNLVMNGRESRRQRKSLQRGSHRSKKTATSISGPLLLKSERTFSLPLKEALFFINLYEVG